MRHAPARPSIAPVAAAALLALGVGPAPGRAAPGEPVELAPQPIQVRSLGMTVRLPVGAALDSTNVGGLEASFTVTPEDGTWILRMHSPRSRDTTLTPAGVTEGLWEEIRASSVGRDPATGRVNAQASAVRFGVEDHLAINGVQAARFYARVPRVDGMVFVTGYTVFPIEPGRFVIFQIDCLEPEFDRVKPIYEAVVSTVRFRELGEVAAERASGVLAGQRLLDRFTSEDLMALAPKGRRFFRLYRPGGTGLEGDDTEVAYQSVEIRPGQRGELDPRRRRTAWRQADRERGLLVEVKARFLEGDRVIDSESSFFMTPDRRAEAWSIRMAVKRGKDSALYTETGARTGDTISVNIVQPGQPPIAKTWDTPDEGYLSLVETYLLPFMLVEVGAELEYAFYTYQPQHSDILLRRDRLARSDRPNEWIVETRPTEDALTDRSVLDQDGYLVRKFLSSGIVMEAVRPEDLARIWRSKGLPTD
ncbi:MAG: hypothetical protein D6693_00960 [Planctomycetota bacterium]|nr:MAG: hypothetical protein D6693_00960 [Planctomycetota bacterium]